MTVGGRSGISKNVEGVEPLTDAEINAIAEQTLGECVRLVMDSKEIPAELEQRRRLVETVLIYRREREAAEGEGAGANVIPLKPSGPGEYIGDEGNEW